MRKNISDGAGRWDSTVETYLRIESHDIIFRRHLSRNFFFQ